MRKTPELLFLAGAAFAYIQGIYWLVAAFLAMEPVCWLIEDWLSARRRVRGHERTIVHLVEHIRREITLTKAAAVRIEQIVRKK